MLYSGAVEAAAGMVVNGTVSSFTSKYNMQEGLDVTLHNLQQEVIKIQCAINAARRRRITEKKLLEWTASLINAVCLGNYYIRILKGQNPHDPLMIANQGMSNLSISPSHRAAKRRRTIKTLIFGDKMLKELQDTLKKLKDIDIITFILMVNAQPERPIRTYLYMDHNRLIYRDRERDQVMNFLFQPSMAGERNFTVLPIVGPWAVGKTSLALHCFLDPKVQNHFSLKIYIPTSGISYSPILGLPTIFAEILWALYGSGEVTRFDMNTQIAMIKQRLSSEKILLLIDDVPVECVESMAWAALWDCLNCGKQGSKVIFVGNLYAYNEYKRDANFGSVTPIVLDGFWEDEYMLFFKEHAFGSTDPDEFPELEEMGREIAKRMDGSIWGAKILGELLRDNLSASFWSKFLHDDILSAESFQDGKYMIDPVIQTISRLLPRRLQILYASAYEEQLFPSHEPIKSFRELMVLDPDHCTPDTVDWFSCEALKILVTKHVFLNECTVYTMVCSNEHVFPDEFCTPLNWISPTLNPFIY
jgi:NB-ARC domain